MSHAISIIFPMLNIRYIVGAFCDNCPMIAKVIYAHRYIESIASQVWRY